jgi:hypothetical protein
VRCLLVGQDQHNVGLLFHYNLETNRNRSRNYQLHSLSRADY